MSSARKLCKQNVYNDNKWSHEKLHISRLEFKQLVYGGGGGRQWEEPDGDRRSLQNRPYNDESPCRGIPGMEVGTVKEPNFEHPENCT